MANKTVSNLNELTTVSNNDVLLVETSTETLKVTKGNLLKEVNEQLNAKSDANHTHVVADIIDLDISGVSDGHIHDNKSILDTITKENRYVTLSEYNALPDSDKNNENIIWNITNEEELFSLSLDRNELNLLRNGVIISTVTLNISGGSEIYGSIVLNSTTLTIQEGKSKTFEVTLSNAPTNTQTVTLSASPSSDVTIVPSELQFDSSNYNVAQTVTVTGVQDDDSTENKTVVLTVSSPNVANKTIDVTVINNNFDNSAVTGEYALFEIDSYDDTTKVWTNKTTNDKLASFTSTGSQLSDDQTCVVISNNTLVKGYFFENKTFELVIKNNWGTISGTKSPFQIGVVTGALPVLLRSGNTIELSNKADGVVTDLIKLDQFSESEYLYIAIVNDTTNNKAFFKINDVYSTEIPALKTVNSSGFSFNSTYPINTSVKVLRIYDRVLTNAELEQNYQYEMSRL